MLDRFAVFILTHGRPNKVLTYHTLRSRGYTGPIYLIVDNEDGTLPEYRQRYGDQVIVFDKQATAEAIDEGDNFKDRRAILYARNASFDIAASLGLDDFLQLDDDYNHFEYRINHRRQYPKGHRVVSGGMDGVIAAYLDYFRSIPAASIAMAQGGDFFGAAEDFGKPLRKCMNSFFCSVRRQFPFSGRVNEDVNTYTAQQRRGHLFLTAPFVSLDQPLTQSGAGGMTGLYLDQGTYIKSFYSVMYAPSGVRIGMMGQLHRRLHHMVTWDSVAPRIIREAHRKSSTRAGASSRAS
jgi:hypothetical protein